MFLRKSDQPSGIEFSVFNSYSLFIYNLITISSKINRRRYKNKPAFVRFLCKIKQGKEGKKISA